MRKEKIVKTNFNFGSNMKGGIYGGSAPNHTQVRDLMRCLAR